MNVRYVKESLRTLILDNEQTLMQDLEHQGELRRIKQVALTNLTPPQGYYYILVYVPDNVEATATTGTTTARPKRVAEYSVQMEISDEALVQTEDFNTNAYETMALDFDLFIDRLEYLLENRNWLDAAGTLKLKRGTGASDRRIERTNLSGPNPEENTMLLFSQLRFTVSQECLNEAALYE